MYRLRRQDGFTLIEAMIVIMYIAILACMILPNITGAGRRARETGLRATLNEMRKAVQSYQAETGLYPFELADLAATEAPDVGLTPSGAVAAIDPADWRGPYLTGSGGGLPKDPTNGGRDNPNAGRMRTRMYAAAASGTSPNKTTITMPRPTQNQIVPTMRGDVSSCCCTKKFAENTMASRKNACATVGRSAGLKNLRRSSVLSEPVSANRTASCPNNLAATATAAPA